MTYLTWEQKRFVIEKCSDAGLILFEWMMSKSSVPEYEFTDENAASAIGWSIRKCKENRLKLQKANLFKKDSYSGSNGKKMNIYTIGEAIQDMINSKKKKGNGKDD